MQQAKQTQQPLYHVKSHDVTIELTDNWPKAFSCYEQLLHKHGKEVVNLITITDRRTDVQKAGLI